MFLYTQSSNFIYSNILGLFKINEVIFWIQSFIFWVNDQSMKLERALKRKFEGDYRAKLGRGRGK